jgi:hypothetical protein
MAGAQFRKKISRARVLTKSENGKAINEKLSNPNESSIGWLSVYALTFLFHLCINHSDANHVEDFPYAAAHL